MNKKVLGLALTMAFTVGTASAATINIDGFSGDSFSQDATFSNVSAGVSDSGFARTASATSSAPDTTLTLNTDPTLGRYSHSQDSGVNGYSQVNFDLNGLDLNDGANAFSLELTTADLNGLYGILINGISSSLSTTSVVVAAGGTLPVFTEFLFSDFAGVDFNSINTVSLFVDGNNADSLDMTIDSFGTSCSSLSVSGVAGDVGTCSAPPSTNVPEPVSLVLLGLGLGFMSFARRNKKA